MIALVSDHGFASLFVSEKKAEEWKAKGAIRRDVNPLYLAGATHTVHCEYFIHKGGFVSPAGNSAEKLFARSGYEREEVEYAWIYDCFAGMVISHAAEYFRLNHRDVARSLAGGAITLESGKQVPVNLLGGLMNYQAAMAMSAATGLVDIAFQHGIYARSAGTGGIVPLKPKVSLLGGNGGIDSISAVALFDAERPDEKRQARRPKLRRLGLNRTGARAGETGTVWSAVTVMINPGFAVQPPYVLAVVEIEKDRCVLAVLRGPDGAILKQSESVTCGASRVRLEREGALWTAILL
jgi:acetyl-CoA acyltransferase